MSAKIAIIIGDYSNGWSDAIIVQDVLPFKTEQLRNDRKAVMAVLSEKLLDVLSVLEGNEVINPKPKDTPCCTSFEEWAMGQTKDSKFNVCPFCSTKITVERRDKYFTAI